MNTVIHHENDCRMRRHIPNLLPTPRIAARDTTKNSFKSFLIRFFLIELNMKMNDTHSSPTSPVKKIAVRMQHQSNKDCNKRHKPNANKHDLSGSQKSTS